ncbi:MAG: hypothetical protein HYR73_09620 [Candidatus Eisenbacteria bacterium]|nr:hypothetical protein [Candidatus Eisenbacteria bacterium]
MKRAASIFFAGLFALLCASALSPLRAHANAEEFSTFDVEHQEEDDESALDHLLTRQPREWRHEWERAPLAFRTSQGCLTSGEWFELNDLKLETALGAQARFGLAFQQRHDNTQSWDDLALRFRFPIRAGRVTFDFHPSYDKARQDFALAWDTGSDTAAFYLSARFMIEDMLNNLWAWRQTRVGGKSEPYLRHPYLPELLLISRHDRWRLEAGGRYLTPSTKQVVGYTAYTPPREQTLWGVFGWGAFETQVLGFQTEARTVNQQATSTDQPTDFSSADHHDFRRQWLVEGTVSRPLGPRWSALARYLYQSRTQLYGAPDGPGRFDALDRIVQIELGRAFDEHWRLRGGLLYDRVAFARQGVTPWTSEAREKESRAYVTLQGRFGRVSVEGTEGIELDHEPYEVVWHHDKGFLKLQSTF